MRIAIFIISTTFHASYGGLETQNKNLAEGLVSAGHEVVVVAPGFGGQNDASLEAGGVDYLFVPEASQGRYDKAWWMGSLTIFKKQHLEKPFDVVISQSAAGAAIIENKKSLGVKVIVVAHGTIWGEVRTVWKKTKPVIGWPRFLMALSYGLKTYYLLDKKYLVNCDHIVAVAEAVKIALLKEFKLPGSKITVIANGVDLQRFNMATQDAPIVNFLYFGRIEKEKGLDVLISALFQLNKEFDNISLSIVGSGPYLSVVKDQVRQRKLFNIVKIQESVAYEQVPRVLGESQVLILPSLRLEGLPMVLVEGAASGLPLVASDIGGNKMVVKNDFNGFLIAAGDVSGLVLAMKRLLLDQGLRERLGIASRQLASEFFSVDLMVKNYLKLL